MLVETTAQMLTRVFGTFCAY